MAKLYPFYVKILEKCSLSKSIIICTHNQYEKTDYDTLQVCGHRRIQH